MQQVRALSALKTISNLNFRFNLFWGRLAPEPAAYFHLRPQVGGIWSEFRCFMLSCKLTLFPNGEKASSSLATRNNSVTTVELPVRGRGYFWDALW